MIWLLLLFWISLSGEVFDCYRFSFAFSVASFQVLSLLVVINGWRLIRLRFCMKLLFITIRQIKSNRWCLFAKYFNAQKKPRRKWDAESKIWAISLQRDCIEWRWLHLQTSFQWMTSILAAWHWLDSSNSLNSLEGRDISLKLFPGHFEASIWCFFVMKQVHLFFFFK